MKRPRARAAPDAWSDYRFHFNGATFVAAKAFHLASMASALGRPAWTHRP
jgi:hypothetical protein